MTKDDPAAELRRRIAAAKKQRTSAEQARVTELSKPDAGLKHNSDLGSPHMLPMMQVVKDQSIPMEPGNPITLHRRGARAQRPWTPDALARMGSISAAGLEAARRYRDDWLLAEHGAGRAHDISGIRVAAWSRVPYSHQQAEARQRSAMVATMLGPRVLSVVMWCVCDQVPNPHTATSVEAWAAHNSTDEKRIDPKKGVGMLDGALEVISSFYETVDKRKRKAAHEQGQ